MKRTIALGLLLLAGCATMERILQPRTLTPEERAHNMYMGYLGLLLMQSAQPQTPIPQIYVIDGRSITCSQMNNVVVCN